jgi:flagellar basal-body rod protein FlgG
MIRSLNTSGTGMVAQQYNLDVIANNLANVNTTAFKQQRAEFQDLMYQTFRSSGQAQNATQVGLGSLFASTASNFAPGPQQPTGNPLDIAINGQGFFRVQRPDGSIAFTRDGSFKMNAEGLLVTSQGYALEPNITIPAEALNVNVAADGLVTVTLPDNQTPVEVGTIQLAHFPNPAGLVRIGHNLYLQGGASGDEQTGAPGENGTGVLQSGFLEGSNVQVVEEMVRMILAQRAYEINSKAIQSADDMLSVLNNLKR